MSGKFKKNIYFCNVEYIFNVALVKYSRCRMGVFVICAIFARAHKRASMMARVTLCFVIICGLGLAPCAHAADITWPAGPYKYAIVNQDVKDVLTEFGQNVHINVKFSDHVQARRLRGPFPITTAQMFLKNVCENAGLVWYYDGVVLHISAASEISTVSFDVGASLASSGIQRRLDKMGVFDERYPVKTDGISGVISVSGPPAYVAAIKQSLQVLAKINGDDKGVRVFRAGREGT